MYVLCVQLRSECETLDESIFMQSIGTCHLSTDERNAVLGSLTGLVVIMVFVRAFVFCLLCVRASGLLHKKMVQSVLRAPVHFFDVNSSGKAGMDGWGMIPSLYLCMQS